MSVPLRDRFGALRERNFRLLFAATSITTIGDRLAVIALAFAVLDIGSATALGLVFAARQGMEALVAVGGGVLSDRLPRNLVLVGASLVQGTAQAATAACVLGGVGGVSAIVALQALYGLGAALIIPAEVGLVPQTVSDERLQQANALQGLTRNLVGVLGPAVGGILVVAASPGIALAVDAVSFLACAFLLAKIRIAARAETETPGFLSELREGWREFTARTWLWASVLFFGLGNLMFAGWMVLGPVVAKSELGGAGPWAAILTSFGVGAVIGSVTAIRIRPSRPLVACVIAAIPLSLQTLSLALGAPAWVVGTCAFLAGIGMSIHLTLWFTVFQREIPERVQSRVASYDTLGSLVLIPIGVAAVGPVSDAIGVTTTLWICVIGMWLTWGAILALPSVWAIRQTSPRPATASA